MNTLKLILVLLISTQVMAGVITPITTFSDGQVLTAAQLNDEFNNHLNTINGGLDDANLSPTANISGSKLDPAIAGDALEIAAGVMAVTPDGVTMETASDAIQIKDGGVTSAKIFDGTVALIDMANNSVDTPELVALSVTAAKIDSLAVTNGKLAENAVTGNKIADLTIGTADIGDSQVTSAKLNLGAVNTGGGTATSTGAEQTVSSLAFTVVSGHPYVVQTIGDGASLSFFEVSPDTTAPICVATTNCEWRLYLDGTRISTFNAVAGAGCPAASHRDVPHYPSYAMTAFRAGDPTGAHTLHLKVIQTVGGGNGFCKAQNVGLMAYSL